MGDIVSSEGSLLWRLTIPPTRFDGFFCESVTRQFESEPEPCGHQDHIWKCEFTENMINGVATVDIVIHRVKIKTKRGSGEDEGDKPASSGDRQQPQQQQEHHQQQEQKQELGSSAESASHSQTHTKTHPKLQVQQEHDQQQEQPEQKQQQQQKQQQRQLSSTKNNTPVPIHYKTIALHTPKTLAPLMAMFLDGSSTGDIPIRVELEANAIRHRGNYVFEIVLSEDISSYMNPSPSSCHRVFDSLYHEIIATSIPDTSTADIWFEFCPHSSTASGAVAADSSTQDRSSLPSILLPVDQRHLCHAQEHNDGGAAVAVVGAHSETLRKYRYFAEWIEREKQEQEEQRRRQLEKEWMVHQEHHEHRRQQQQPQQQQQQQQSHPYFPWRHLEPPHHPSEPQIGEFEDQQRLTWVGQPPPATTSSSRSSHRNDQQQQAHPQYRVLQRDEYHPREIPTYFQPLQGPHSSSSSKSSPSSTSSPPSVTPQQQQSSLLPKHQNQQLYSRPETTQSRRQVAEQQQVPPPPALRIPVKNVSLGTFQVILQYIYTGSIGLSDGQIKDVEEYWNGNPENHLAPQQKRNPLDDEDMPLLSSSLAYYHAGDQPADSPESGESSGRIAPRFPIVLPIPEALKEVLNDQQEGGGGGEGGQEIQGRSNTSIRDIVMSTEIYTFTTASAQTAWIPCSPRNRRKEFRDPVSPRPSHTRQQPPVSGSGQEEHATGCSSGQSQGDEGGQTSSGSTGFQSVTGPSASSSSTSTSTANTSVHSPTHQLHVYRTRPTCSWESLLVAANLFHLQDLETTALKAIKYHCQMLASRALINNNVVAEVAHDGFDTSNLDLQLVLGERILLSLLRLYKLRALRVHPEGVRVLRGSDRESGSGGGESKCRQEHAHVEPAGGRQSQLEERFRREEQVQQGSSSDGGEGEERKESRYESDDKNQQKWDEGHLKTIPTASGSSSSSSARTRGGRNSSGGRASSRTRGSRRLSSGYGQGRGQAAIGEGSIGGNTDQEEQHLSALERGRESYSSARTRTRTNSRHQQQQRQAGTQEHGDNGGNESQRQPSGDRRSASREQREDEQDAEENEERSGSGAGNEGITTTLALLDHPQCEAALQGLCEELRERFLSLREVMEYSPRIDARPD